MKFKNLSLLQQVDDFYLCPEGQNNGLIKILNFNLLSLQELRAREDIFFQLLKQMNCVFWIMDANTKKIVYISPGYEKIWGDCSYSDRIPDYLLFLESIYEQDLQKITNCFVRMKTKGDKIDEEYRIKTVNGPRWIRIRAFPIRDVNNKIIRFAGLLEDITLRKEREQVLLQRATIDLLTGANNRYFFLEKAQLQLNKALRNSKSLTFLMLDIDNFKQINDSFGHHIGDEVLKEMVKECNSSLGKDKDTVLGRIGGEEFGIVLYAVNELSSLKIAEQLRKNLARISMKTDFGNISFTVSIGAAYLKKGEKSIEQLMKRADKALYLAKRAGRNCVFLENQRLP